MTSRYSYLFSLAAFFLKSQIVRYHPDIIEPNEITYEIGRVLFPSLFNFIFLTSADVYHISFTHVAFVSEDIGKSLK